MIGMSFSTITQRISYSNLKIKITLSAQHYQNTVSTRHIGCFVSISKTKHASYKFATNSTWPCHIDMMFSLKAFK